ncbi:MAG: hypothetical protein M1836_002325 [Candelina mexicana]|nr:MAG: hypothetical protein M1836_002325 [Candelina mexicana]
MHISQAILPILITLLSFTSARPASEAAHQVVNLEPRGDLSHAQRSVEDVVNIKRSPEPEPRCLCFIDDKPCQCGGPIVAPTAVAKRAPEPEPRCLCIINGKPCECGGPITPPSKRSPDPECQCLTLDGPCHCGAVKRSPLPEPEPRCVCRIGDLPCHCGGPIVSDGGPPKRDTLEDEEDLVDPCPLVDDNGHSVCGPGPVLPVANKDKVVPCNPPLIPI